MSLLPDIAVMALRPFLGNMLEQGQALAGDFAQQGVAAAPSAAAKALTSFVVSRFTDPSKKLPDALRRSADRAWRSLEVALAGESWWTRLRDRGEDKAFRQQVRLFLDARTLDLPGRDEAFRQRCLDQLRSARKARLIPADDLAPKAGPELTADFTRFCDPTQSREAEWGVAARMAKRLRGAGHSDLADLLELRPPDPAVPLLAVAVRFFFRREVETDTVLFQGFLYAQVDQLGESMRTGFERLGEAFAVIGPALEQQGESLERILDHLHALRGDVLDIRGEMVRQGADQQAMYREVIRLGEKLDCLHDRALRPADSLSIRGQDERQVVKQLVAHYRALPDDQRQRLPALLAGVGRLEMAAGDFAAARADFGQLTHLVSSPGDKAAAHYGAYLAALESLDWNAALKQLTEAVRLDPTRFAPFPNRYEPERILGAGGFGVAFLCRDQNRDRLVVVKALRSENLDQDGDTVMAEARTLDRINHPAVVKLLDCDYADRATRSRPYLVMEYFESFTLQEYVGKQGPLSPADLLAVARPVAEALAAAHREGIVHRDVKPANVLVNRDSNGWQVRLIDFGLALKQGALQSGGDAESDGRSLIGASIAGTREYAAPEQMGKLPGVAPREAADIYGFAKTCCFARFGTPQPLRRHWSELPPHVSELLERCLEEDPSQRPRTFGEVLDQLVDQPPGEGGDGGRARILEQFVKRLNAGIGRSPLLKVTIRSRGRLLDLARLATLEVDLPTQVLAAVLDGTGKAVLDLRPRRMLTRPNQGDPDPAGTLFDMLNRRIRRDAELAKRETGVHALWLGYPLIYMASGDEGTERWVLAPVFLWPVDVEPDSRLERHLRLGRASEPNTIRFNRVLAQWVKRELDLKLDAPDDEDLPGLDRAALTECLSRLAAQVGGPALFNPAAPLESVPDRNALAGVPPRRLLNAAVLGYIRWQNEAVLADVEALRTLPDIRGVASGFVSAARLAQPSDAQAPPEEDRYLVSPADFSQERVVWQSRLNPGLVVHGPPGTGKSQTIVNIIADYLLREKTVLMVCQKQAATRVVMERLRAVGLDNLCLEVHDAEQDRRAVFRTLKNQVEGLAEVRPADVQGERRRLSQEIEGLEKELDAFARALHARRPRFGLSYRDMWAWEQRAYREFASVRPLRSLEQVLGGLTAEEVEEVARRAREAGSWFAEGDPLGNPWRFGRLESIQPSSIFREDVLAALSRVRAHDAAHQEFIRQGGAGTPLPADLARFAEVGAESLKQLRALARSPESLTLVWLRTCRGSSGEQRRQWLEQAQRVVQVAESVRAAPIDPRWAFIAARTPEFTSVAEDVIRRIESLGREESAGVARVTVGWLAALLDDTERKLSDALARCKAAENLARQVASSPLEETWHHIGLREPRLEVILTPVLERVAKIAGESERELGKVARAWIRKLRGQSAEQFRAAEARCRHAIELCQHAVARLTRLGGIAGRVQEADLPMLLSVLERINGLRADPTSLRLLLVRRWLRVLRAATEEELQKRADACGRRENVAREIAAALNPAWDGPCASWTVAELDGLCHQAEELLRVVGTWSRFFSTSSRRASSQLRRLRPGTTEPLINLAASFVAYVRARKRREQLADWVRWLLPGESSPTVGQQPQFLRLAREAFESAAWLLRQERGRDWFRDLLDEFLLPGGRPGPVEAALRLKTESAELHRQLHQVNLALTPGPTPASDPAAARQFPGLAQRGLAEAVWLLDQETQHPWLSQIIDPLATRKEDERLASAKSARLYLAGRRLRAGLAEANRNLCPPHQPPADGGAQVRFPQIARMALDAATELCRLRDRHSWISPLLEECLGAARPQDLSFAGLNAYVRAVGLRAELVWMNSGLVPGRPAAPDEASQLRFPAEAHVGLREADRLWTLASEHHWVGILLEALLADPAGAALVGGLAELERGLRRAPLVKGLLDALLALRLHLRDVGLKEPYLAAKAGEAVAPWADCLERGLAGLPALINLHLDRQTWKGATPAAIAALEEYERARLTNPHLPAPGGRAEPDSHGRWWAALVTCSAAQAWRSRCHEEFPALARFSAQAHEEKVRRLADLLVRKRALEAQAIRDRWLPGQQSVRGEAAWNRIFQERDSRYGKSQRLREAVDEGWDKGLWRLRPCWLVNPAAAAQIFPLTPGLFDLVIFDEASQCPLEQAAPAIYRGKRLVVSGDEKQLPPTTFFTAATDDDGEDGEEAPAEEGPAEAKKRRRATGDLLGASDLLDAAVGKLKQLYLSVHYRSDHPALIDFSNRAFYDGQLEAPPSCRASAAGERPIEYHAVVGRYAERTNEEEARHVVALLRGLWDREATPPTVGVVTFNQAQRDRIEDFLEAEGRADEVFSGRYAAECDRKQDNQDVGFFVKNLENVQGDERDVMIFSTTFGRDVEGRFFRRFGPVAATGGHRRLNVAVTRAKRQIIVVSSMPVEEVARNIDVQTEQLTAAGYLRLYLEYARAVAAGNEVAVRRILDRLCRPRDPSGADSTGVDLLADDVASALAKMGYAVERGVGDAGFRIDLGVLHPDGKSGFVLGVECDGGAWRDDRSARVREVWRPGILCQRRWRLYRVWSAAWWADRDREVKALREALAAAIR